MSKEASAVTPKVFAKIAAVQGDLAQRGISKDSENSFDRYKFRGIDAVYNALAPLLAKHGLVIMPRMIERDCQERVSRKGEPMFYITVTAEFDFIAAEDGSMHVVRTYGEAMDRSDKGTNKAMSAAYKYAAFMTFAIPTEGDNDADSETPDPAPRQQQRNAPKQAPQPASGGMPDGPYNDLMAALAAARLPESFIIEKYRVKSVRDLGSDTYAQAMEQLKAKAAQIAAEATNGEFAGLDVKGFDQ